MRTHGLSKTVEHAIWRGMLVRCQCPTNSRYKYYGGRGIRVCRRWCGPKGFANFLADMGTRPAGHELDRRRNDGDYKPSNCRWVPHVVNSRNRSTTLRFSFRGERPTLREWSDRFGLTYHALYNRVFVKKWSLAEALSGPKRKRA